MKRERDERGRFVSTRRLAVCLADEGCREPATRGEGWERRCARHWLMEMTARRKRNRAMGLCACGVLPRPGYRSCERCGLRDSVRAMRRALRCMPRKRLRALLPDDLRRYGEAGIEMYRRELPRRIVEASAEVERIKEEIAEKIEAAPTIKRLVLFCTKCRRVPASPGRKRCERCRARHREYMARRRSDPGYREIEQARQNQRRAAFGRSDAHAVAIARSERLRAQRLGELAARIALDAEAVAQFADG